MKVENLHIEKRANYDTDYPNQLVGTVQIIGESGKMEVKLSSKTVADIFNLIKNDVQKVATYNAEQAADAVTEAAENVKLLGENIPIAPPDNAPF